METQLIERGTFSFSQLQNMSYFDFKYYGKKVLEDLIKEKQ